MKAMQKNMVYFQGDQVEYISKRTLGHENDAVFNHHFQKTFEPHLYLSFPSHSSSKSSEMNGTFCINKNQEGRKNRELKTRQRQ